MAKRYSAKLKFQVVTEILSGEKSAALVAKAYGIHPNTPSTGTYFGGNLILSSGSEVIL